MQKSKSKTLPDFKSLNELVEFFDTHDLGEYWDEMPESNFEINLKKKTHLFHIDGELAVRLTEIAKSRQISSQTLVNDWLKEKIMQQV
jgi:hypothetical protein